MKRTTTSMMLAAAILAVNPLSADTLKLATGGLLEGEFLGGNNGIIMFDTGDGLQAFPHAQVVAVYLSEGLTLDTRPAFSSRL